MVNVLVSGLFDRKKKKFVSCVLDEGVAFCVEVQFVSSYHKMPVVCSQIEGGLEPKRYISSKNITPEFVEVFV